MICFFQGNSWMFYRWIKWWSLPRGMLKIQFWLHMIKMKMCAIISSLCFGSFYDRHYNLSFGNRYGQKCILKACLLYKDYRLILQTKKIKNSRITTILTQLIPHGGNNCKMKTFKFFDSLMVPRIDVNINKCYQFV